MWLATCQCASGVQPPACLADVAVLGSITSSTYRHIFFTIATAQLATVVAYEMLMMVCSCSNSGV
jgi:hypothetical protein